MGVGVWSKNKKQNKKTQKQRNVITEPSPAFMLQTQIFMALILPAIITESVRAGPNINVISCLCLWTDRWSSLVNFCNHTKKPKLYSQQQSVQDIYKYFVPYISGLNKCKIKLYRGIIMPNPNIPVHIRGQYKQRVCHPPFQTQYLGKKNSAYDKVV